MLADRLYPVNLSVSGRAVLVVGAGRVAAWKARELLECGAQVTMVAPVRSTEAASLDAAALGAGEAALTWLAEPYSSDHLDGVTLVITATDDPAVNRAVAADAAQRGLWVNAADDPENCTFSLPSRLRRDSLLIAVSTSGKSPALATWIRRRLEGEIGPEYSVLLDILAEERAAIRSEGRSTEGLNWLGALDSGMLELIRQKRLVEAKERLQACLSSSSE